MRIVKTLLWIILNGKRPTCIIYLDADKGGDVVDYWTRGESVVFKDYEYLGYIRGRQHDMDEIGKKVKKLFPLHRYQLKHIAEITVTNWALSLDMITLAHFSKPKKKINGL